MWDTGALSEIERLAVWLAAVTAGMSALGWLARAVVRRYRAARSLWRKVAARADALDRLVSHELTPNSGGSMKDAVTRLDAGQHELRTRVAALEDSLGSVAESQHLIWPAIQAVAEAEPPRTKGINYGDD